MDSISHPETVQLTASNVNQTLALLVLKLNCLKQQTHIPTLTEHTPQCTLRSMIQSFHRSCLSQNYLIIHRANLSKIAQSGMYICNQISVLKILKIDYNLVIVTVIELNPGVVVVETYPQYVQDKFISLVLCTEWGNTGNLWLRGEKNVSMSQ